MPYLKFPDNWPVFSPKDKIADWLESYTKIMELNYWSSTHIVRSATLMDIGLSALYSEQAVDAGITTDKADLIFASIPYRIKVGKCWGLGSDTTKDPGPWEGEQRNMWRPTQQEALWFTGGNLHQSRHYSLYLGQQLKARQAGLPTPVYGLQEVHHLG
jgi:cation diffusion facilitator CzcD-associated flavoprotein CzcO